MTKQERKLALAVYYATGSFSLAAVFALAVTNPQSWWALASLLVCFGSVFGFWRTLERL